MQNFRTYFFKLQHLIFFILTVSILNTSLCFTVQAHETESSDSIPFEEIYGEILTKAASLDYHDVPENAQNFEPHLIGARKYLLVGPRTYIKIDNAFWDLADSLSKLYIAEFKRVCEECRLPSIERLQVEAKAMVAKGWFSENSKKLREIFAYRYAGAFVTLGGRYGPAAGVIKLIGEFMEEVMLFVFKIPGAHIFCNIITTAIAIYAGKTNTFLRSFSMSEHSNIGFMSTPRALARLLVTSYIMRSALKRMAIEVKSFEIDSEELEHFLSEEKETKLLYKITGRHRVRNFIQKLSKIVETKNRKNNSGETELSYFKEIQRKTFEGRRYGMTLLLKKRKQADSLGEFADLGGKLTGGTHFWIMGLTNDILDPLTELKSQTSISQTNSLLDLSNNPIQSLNSESFSEISSNEILNTQLTTDPITDYQIATHLNEHPENLTRVFASLDAITDYDGRSMKQRRIELAFFQAYIAGVLPRLMSEMVDSVIQQYDSTDKRLLKIYKLYYKLGQIYYYSELLVDFLRFAAVAKSTKDPFIKYHIRDYFTQIHETVNYIRQFQNARHPNDLDLLVERLNQKINELKSNRFWIEKRHSLNFFPDMISKPLSYLFHPIDKIKDFSYYVGDLHSYGWIGSRDLESPNAKYKRPIFQTGAPSCESLYL